MQKEISAKSFDRPDVMSELSSSRADIVQFEGFTGMRITFQPGMRYSRDVRPHISADQERVPTRLLYCQSGRLHFVQPGGLTVDFEPGGIYLVPPWENGFEDNWVVGDEPCVLIAFIPADLPPMS